MRFSTSFVIIEDYKENLWTFFCLSTFLHIYSKFFIHLSYTGRTSELRKYNIERETFFQSCFIISRFTSQRIQHLTAKISCETSVTSDEGGGLLMIWCSENSSHHYRKRPRNKALGSSKNNSNNFFLTFYTRPKACCLYSVDSSHCYALYIHANSSSTTPISATISCCAEHVCKVALCCDGMRSRPSDVTRWNSKLWFY